MTILRGLAAISFSACILTACGGATSTTTDRTQNPADGGANTHDGGIMTADASKGPGGWSATCVGSEDCRNGFVCFCGLCSTPCTPETDCKRFSDKATCPSGVPLTPACIGPNATSKPSCAVVCNTDADCRGLGAPSICSGGFCKMPELVTYEDGGIVSCDERTAAMTPDIVNAFAQADRSCKTDADCTLVPFNNQCYGLTCAAIPISSDSEAMVTAQLSALETRDCQDFFAAGCVGPGISGCPSEPLPNCIDGTCEFPIVTSTGEKPHPTCDDRAQEIDSELTVYETSADLTCTHDTDCLNVDLVSCAGGCGTLISKSGLDALAAPLAAIELTRCAPFAAAGCHAEQPRCAPPVPRCIAHTCSLGQAF